MRGEIGVFASRVRVLTGSLLVAVWVALAGSAHAGLVGLSSGSPGHLYSIDAATGAATGGPSIGLFSSLVGLEYLGGQLYASDVANGSFSFGTINQTTGAYTVINNQGGSANWHGLAANESAQLFYTIDLNDGNRLKSITTSGVIATIGVTAPNIGGSGMAYDDGNGILYAATFGGALYRVDTATGATTFIGATGVAGDVGLAFDEDTDTLYANISLGSSANLYTLDVATGAATLVGANGPLLAGDRSIDGLAWISDQATVPEPGSLAVVGLALLALGRQQLRRRA